MTFAFPLLFWIGLPLVALPAIIHFLNLRRQQRVPWAAMSFLLESQQRSKTWINLKELLLLLLRTVAVALLVLLLARPSLQSGWLNQWLGEPTHHLVLLDDSYSATERFGDTTAWQQTRGAAASIIRRASDQSQANRLTLLRYSEAAKMGESIEPAILRKQLDPETREDVLTKLEGWQATAGDSSLAEAMRVADQLVGQWSDDKLVVHLLGDFRSRDLQPEEDVMAQLVRVRDKVDHLHLVGSVRSEQQNLAISGLAIVSGTLASGVEVWAEIAVTNFGATMANKVVAEIEQDDKPLSSVELGDVPPGETIRQRFRCRFADPGPHSLAATIDEDAVAVDDRRWLSIDVPEQIRVLMVDGSPDEWESYFLSTALGPGGGTTTGWSTETTTTERLSSLDRLDQFAMIALLDVKRLDEESLSRVEQFVASGGGLFVALGESIDRDWYRDAFYKNAEGLLPAPPTLPTQWVPENDKTAVDVQVVDHPAFRVFASQQNSFLPLLKIDYYYALAKDWQQQAPADVNVIAKLANGAPLVVERAWGKGRIIALYTPVANTPGTLGSWSNLSLNPAFPVLANEMFAWLSAGKRADRSLVVGDVITQTIDPANFVGTGRLVGVSDGLALETTLAASDLGESLAVVSPPLVEPGLYELQLARTAGGEESLIWSVHPNSAEGDLRLPQVGTLKQKLAGSNFSFEWADSLIGSGAASTGTSLVESLFVLLVCVLAIEQVFAYLCSYHD